MNLQIMTMEDIKSRLHEVNYFYGFMYGFRENDLSHIIKIKLEEVSIVPEGIRFIWGWPGPSYNTYLWNDYGKTWAYTREELVH